MAHYFPECAEENGACICDTYREPELEWSEKPKFIWCDECHYYHDKPSDCEYVTPQPVVYYDPSVTNAPN